MKYRRLGNTGLIVSEIGLGTMQFGQKMNMGNLDRRATQELVEFGIDLGVNFIDTADVYSLGESEEFVGEAVSGKRQELVLASKCRLPMSDDFNRSGATRVNIMRSIESSLKRLRTDYLDLYQIHGWDSNTPLEETVRALDDLVRDGKVRYIGLSNYLSWQATTALWLQDKLNLHHYATAQMYYSLVGRELEYDFLPMAEYHDLGILVWSPLAGGFLSGKYDRDHPAPPGTRFAEAGNFVPFDHEMGFQVVDVLRRIAQRHDCSPARVALAWLLSRPAVSAVIAAGRKKEHLADNLKASALELGQDELAELDRVSDPGTPYPLWMVKQLDEGEDPRPRVLHPERYAAGGPWADRRTVGWEP